MRGIETGKARIRHEVFTEIARMAYEGGDYAKRLEELPFKIIPGEIGSYRDSLFLERAVVGERLRLAMGLPLRKFRSSPCYSDGVERRLDPDIYYERPLINVIKFACNRCPDNVVKITNVCQGCLEHPCMAVCPRQAITRQNGQAHIDQDKCIKCGKCKAACPYDAIAHEIRPCAEACGVNAIESDDLGRAYINPDRCVSCGMCMVNCPFGAIADKSQIFQLIRALKEGGEIVAEVAPAIVGQFGPHGSPKRVKAALMELGFSEVYEVALGADMGAATEARHYVEEVVNGDLPFLLTSCCPSWSMLAKVYFPEMIDKISNALTPMVATARTIKQKHPNARVVFIGPCASKKLEASRRSVRSDVDFVITFEELDAIFEAKGIDMSSYDKEVELHDATGAGRGYAVAGGVAEAIEKCVNAYYPGVDVNIEHAEGLAECRKILMMAKAGKMDGCLIEGMGCPGGCVNGGGSHQVPYGIRNFVDIRAERAKVLYNLDAKKSCCASPMRTRIFRNFTRTTWVSRAVKKPSSDCTPPMSNDTVNRVYGK